MVLAVTDFLSKRLPTVYSSSDGPLFNAVPITTGGSRLADFRGMYRMFWNRFKKSPELVSTLGIPITDILGDRPEFVSIEGSKLGRNKQIAARKFWRDNRGKEVLRSWLHDVFLTGDGYLWKGRANKKEIERAVKEVTQRMGVTFSPIQMKELQTKMSQDEDVKKTKRIDYIAASTVTIIHDQRDIQGYEQNASGIRMFYEPEDVIHYRYMTINGEVEGFAPAEALVAETLLLLMIKENMISYMKNGGSPDKAFILPKEMAKSKNHQYLIETLRKYKSIENRHGNLVFTGELDIQDLQGSPKDLEYKDLALYLTSIMAFAYGIPVSRIPYLIGSAASKGDSGGLSESGYWNKISDAQDTIEDLLNSQLFEEMGFHIKFQRKYKQDEVREAQRASMNADTVQKYQSIMQSYGKQLKPEKLADLLGLSEDDFEDMTEDMQLASSGMMGQNQLSNRQVMPEQDNQRKAMTKKNSANQKGSDSARVNGT